MAKKSYGEEDWFKDPPREEGWLPWREASELLGIPGQLPNWEYISRERAGETESWVLLLPEVAARLGLANAVSGQRKRRLAPADPSGFTQQKRIPSKNYPWGTRPIYISDEETAQRLGFCLEYTRNLLRRGMFMPITRNRRRFAVLQLVERYLDAKSARAERRRAPKPRAYRVESGVPKESERADGGADGGDSLAGVWIPIRKAREILGLGGSVSYLLIRQGKLASRTKSPRKTEVPLSQVMDLLEKREDAKRRGTISVKEWKYDLRHPIYRTKLEAAPGDTLITRREAAEILGCRPPGVSKLVLSGKLFGWQTQPGKQGVPLFLSRNQVIRYSGHPLRLKYLESRRGGKADVRTRNAWREEYGIDPSRFVDSDSESKRSHGEYYTTAQAARVLGVSSVTVQTHRRRKRLTGYRKPIKVGIDEQRRWWFFKKEEVHSLMNDPGYLKKRATFRRTRTPEARAACLAKQFSAPEYIPHDPRNARFLPLNVRLRDREREEHFRPRRTNGV